MKTAVKQKKSGGFALMALMACLVTILVVFAGLMYWVTTNARQMQRNRTFTSTQAAAEGATEVVFAHMDRDYLYGNLNSISNYVDLAPYMTNWPVQYNFDVKVDIGQPTAVLSFLSSQYTNLIGEPQTNTITVTATPVGQLYNVPATVSQSYIFATVPAFQFAIFYNINLEIDPGGTMPIQGPVFSNGGIWSGTGNVTYSKTVQAAAQVNTSNTDPFCNGKSGSGGTPSANFLLVSTPPQPVSNVNPLILPIGASGGTNNSATNVAAIVNIPPPSVAAPLSIAYVQTNQVYDFNAASLIVSNVYYGTNGGVPWGNNFTVYLQDSIPAPYYVISQGVARHWVQLTNDFYIVTNINHSSTFVTNYVPNFQFTNNTMTIKWVDGTGATNRVWYAGFSFLTNVAFYDFREGTMAQAVQLDVGKLDAWLTTATNSNGGTNWSSELCEDIGHGIDSVFIYNAVPFIGQHQLPAVRVVNGQLLPCTTNYNVTVSGTNYPVIVTRGLTVVTPQPLYVMGHYNVQINGGSPVFASQSTANTYPAAFMADSITILSSNWVDQTASAAGQSYTARGALDTTINAACLEGIVQSIGNNYSGGVENFLRLLQDWGGGHTLTYNGSILVMFPSQFATNLWQAPSGGSSYYGVPTRKWGFDTNFLTAAGLPPLTPNFRTVVRNSWFTY